MAAAVALDTLQQGGNAIDAALAASAVQCVVEQPWCGLGGDAFILIRTAEHGVVAFNGSGPAPQALAAERINAPRVPRYGPLSVGVPGVAATWHAVASRYATRPLTTLVEPAVEYARDGFAVYPRLERAFSKLRNDGPHTGQRYRQPALARALEHVAAEGLTGWVRDSIVDFLTERGGALDREDLNALVVTPESPIWVAYRGRTVYTQPPVSLGCVLLQELKILEGYTLGELEFGGPELIDLLVRCKQAAFADAAHLGDPNEVDNRLDWLLSDERAAYWHNRLSARLQPVAVGGGSDTTSTIVADVHGNVVCLIQSLFNEWGSRELVPASGIVLNDRLANLSTDPNKPNSLKGGRRPLHTLNTYMVLDEDDQPILAGSTPGGRGQVQTNLQVLVNALDLGMDVQTAVDAPRWISGLPYRGENDQTLYLERAFPSATVDALHLLGHTIQVGVQAGDQADPFGNCTVISRSTTDATLQGAADLRRDACAIGW